MASEPEAKFAIHEAAREGKSECTKDKEDKVIANSSQAPVVESLLNVSLLYDEYHSLE